MLFNILYYYIFIMPHASHVYIMHINIYTNKYIQINISNNLS